MKYRCCSYTLLSGAGKAKFATAAVAFASRSMREVRPHVLKVVAHDNYSIARSYSRGTVGLSVSCPDVMRSR